MTESARAARYYVRVKDREHTVEVAETAAGLEVIFDGEPVEADLVVLHGSSLHSLLLDGHSRELVLEREGQRTYVSLDGERTEVHVEDELSHALCALGQAAERPLGCEIAAPMPGVVVDVLVNPGEEVKAGEPVVVVEAMKMQNELAPDTGGVVETIRVQAGDSVEKGEILAVVRAKEGP